MHLLVAPALASLVLIEAHEIAVVALVQRGILDDRQIFLVKLAQDEFQRVLGPFQGAGEGEVEAPPLILEHGAGAMRFGDAFFRQIDILPAGEHVEAVPLAFAMTHQNQRIRHGRRLFAWTARHRGMLLSRPPNRLVPLVCVFGAAKLGKSSLLDSLFGLISAQEARI